jgi:ABC-type uncharacterized transport system substrate-binding protein
MQCSWTRLIALAMAALFCPCVVTIPVAHAHPHVWVKVETEMVFDKHQALTGFRHKWTFDEAYSSFAVEGADANKDGTYDRQELKQLAEVNVTSLKEFDYFTFPKLGSELLKRLPPKDYWLEYHDKKLTLFFTLPLAEPLPIAKIKTFNFSVYDPTYYVDFGLAEENPITLAGAPAGCQPLVKEPEPPSADQSLLSNAQSGGSWVALYAKVVSLQCPAS